MEIAIIAHDMKKELITQFCIAYCGILSKHNICATGITAKYISDATGLKQDHTETYNTVYWTKGGGVYHLYKDCSYIKSSSEIISGSIEDALEEKKSGVCSRCENRRDKE